jgi:hypothetical protein
MLYCCSMPAYERPNLEKEFIRMERPAKRNATDYISLFYMHLVPLAATKELCYFILAQFSAHPVKGSVHGTRFYIKPSTRVAD